MPQTESVPLDRLTPYPGNPRRGDVAAIAKSLETLGQYRPIVVNRGSKTGRLNEVLAGNHTTLAARHLGWSELLVHFVDVDEVDAARIVTADNRISDLATYDDQLLADLLDSLPDLDGTGYSQEDLDRIQGTLLGPDTSPPEDFTEYGDDIAVAHECPSCGYEWSGKPSQTPTHKGGA